MVGEQPRLIHSDIISEILDIETEDMHDEIFGPVLGPVFTKLSLYSECEAKACINIGLATDNQAR